MSWVRWVLPMCCVTGCINDHLVPCGDTVCPIGDRCDVERSTCIDKAGLSVPSAPIDLADVPCGSQGERVLSIKSFADTAISFSAVATLSSLSVSPQRGMFDPGATVDLHIVGLAPSESIPGSPIEGSILIATDTEVIERPARLTTVGGVMTSSLQQLDFGEATIGVGDTRMFTVDNTGNATIGLDVGLSTMTPATIPPSFALPSGASVQIAPGETTSVAVAFQPFGGLVKYTSSVAMSFTGSMCQPPPTTVDLSGLATTDEILVDHLALDFGDAACGAARITQPLKLTNNLPTLQPLTIAITGPDAALFDVLSAPSVGPSSAITMTVGRNLVPTTTTVGTHGATLQIDAPGPPATTKLVTLSQSVTAPVLDASPRLIDFGTMSKNTTAYAPLTLLNTGNGIASVSISPTIISLPGGGRFQIVGTGPYQIPPHSSIDLSVQAVAGTTGHYATCGSGFTIIATGACSDPVFVEVDVIVP